MAGEVRHHRADSVGVSKTERCVKSRLRDLTHLYTRGDPRGLPLGAGDCKGVSHENPFAQAERPTKVLGTTYQACGDFQYNRLFKPHKSPQPPSGAIG